MRTRANITRDKSDDCLLVRVKETEKYSLSLSLSLAVPSLLTRVSEHPVWVITEKKNVTKKVHKK